MIDYDATLNKFFDLVIAYLEKRKKIAPDIDVLKKIQNTIAYVRMVAADPKRFADYDERVKVGMELHEAEAFMAGTTDNSAYVLYSRVLWALSDFYGEFEWNRGEARKMLLKAKKAMEYKNSTNVLKDFYYPFLSPERFAEKVKQR